MNVNRFACAALVGLAATAHATCHLSEDNRSLTVLEGESCAIEVDSDFDNIVSVGTVEIAEDVTVGAESFYSRSAILRSGSKLVGSTFNTHDGNYLFEDNAALEFDDAIEFEGASALNAGSNVVFSAPSLDFALDTTLNGIEFGAFVDELVGDATTYTLPTIEEMAHFSAEKLRDVQFKYYNCAHNLNVANAELEATEALRANVNATVRYLASSLFTTQAEASTCKTVVVEVQDTLETVVEDLTVATAEVSSCVEEKTVLIENYDACTTDLTTYIEAAPPAIVPGLAVPDYSIDELPAVPGDLVFEYSFVVASDTVIAAGDLDNLNAAVESIVARQFGLEVDDVSATSQTDGANDAVVTVSINLPPNQTTQFARDTNARLNKYTPEVIFDDLSNEVPSFSVAGLPAAAPVAPVPTPPGPVDGGNPQGSVNHNKSSSDGGNKASIIGAVTGVGGVIVGIAGLFAFQKFAGKTSTAKNIDKMTSSKISPNSTDDNNTNFQIYNPLDGSKGPAGESERRVSFVPTGSNTAKAEAPNVNVSVMSLPESTI